jgi:hypothetical protein
LGMEAGKPDLTEKKQIIDRVPDEKGRMIFPPGQSGNPNGRPKGTFSMVTLIKKKAVELYPGDPDKQKTYGDKVIEQMFNKAINDNDIAAIKEIVDRIDGKAPQHISQDIKGEMNVNATDELLRRIDGIAARIGKTEGDK